MDRGHVGCLGLDADRSHISSLERSDVGRLRRSGVGHLRRRRNVGRLPDNGNRGSVDGDHPDGDGGDGGTVARAQSHGDQGPVHFYSASYCSLCRRESDTQIRKRQVEEQKLGDDDHLGFGP